MILKSKNSTSFDFDISIPEEALDLNFISEFTKSI